jgi:hypothetical protein
LLAPSMFNLTQSSLGGDEKKYIWLFERQIVIANSFFQAYLIPLTY